MEEDPGIQVDGKGRTRLAQDSEGDDAHVSELDHELEGSGAGCGLVELGATGAEKKRVRERAWASARGCSAVCAGRGVSAGPGAEQRAHRLDLVEDVHGAVVARRRLEKVGRAIPVQEDVPAPPASARDACRTAKERTHFVQLSSAVQDEWLRCDMRYRSLGPTMGDAHTRVGETHAMASAMMDSLKVRGLPCRRLPLDPSGQESAAEAFFPVTFFQVGERHFKEEVLGLS